VRAGSRIDDGVGAADELELVVAPVGLLGAFVRAVADRHGPRGERGAGVAGVEVELDHLPVALVQVVEIVENPEEPVLQREHPRLPRIRSYMRVHGRRVALAQPAVPAFVVAAWVKSVAREVEVVAVEAGDVFGRRGDLDEIGPVPRPAQGDGRLLEEEVDVERPVGLSVAALLLLLDDPNDGCVAFGEGLLVGVVGASDGGQDEHGAHPERGDCRGADGKREGGGSHCSGFEAKRSSPALCAINLAVSCPFTILRGSSVMGGAVAAARPEDGIHDRAHDDDAAREPKAEEDRRSEAERAVGVLAGVSQPDNQELGEDVHR
jgi:hypothetical protein